MAIIVPSTLNYPVVNEGIVDQTLLWDPVRSFLTLGGVNESGSFAPVTLRGDFKIKFKAVFSNAAGLQAILGRASTNSDVIYVDNGFLKTRLVNGAYHVWGALPDYNKIAGVEIGRTGMSVYCLIEGESFGTPYDEPGDIKVDQYAAYTDTGYFDNVIFDLEIIDLDQPIDRDVLTFGGVNEYGEMDAPWVPGADWEVTREFSTTSTSNHSLLAGVADLNFNMKIISGVLWVLIGDGVVWQRQIDSATVVNDGQNHVAIVRKVGADYTVKLDGVEVYSGTDADPVTPEIAYVGKSSGGEQSSDTPFDVKLHDLTTPSNSRRYRFDTKSTSHVLDSYQELGAELTTNSNFIEWADATYPDDWNNSFTTDATSFVNQEAGGLRFVSIGGSTQIDQETSISGNTEIWTIEVTEITGVLWMQNFSTSVFIITEPGIYSAVVESGNTQIRIKRGSDVNALIKSISVKEVTNPLTLNNVVDGDWEAMSRDTVSGELVGLDLFTNSGFDSDTAWGKGGGWSISGGKAHRIAQGSNTDLYQDVAGTVNNATYRFGLSITAITQEGFKVRVTGGVYSQLPSTVGLHTTNVVASASGATRIRASDMDVTGSIDYVFLRHIIADPNYIKPVNILWRLNQGRFGTGAYETDARSGLGAGLNRAPGVIESPWVDNLDGSYTIDGSQGTPSLLTYSAGFLSENIPVVVNLTVYASDAGALLRLNNGDGNSGDIAANGTYDILFGGGPTTSMNLQAFAGIACTVRINSIKEAPHALALNNIVAGGWQQLTKKGANWLGVAMVVNGRFDTGADWSSVNDTGGAWSISGGKASVACSTNSILVNDSGGAIITGHSYKARYEMSDYISGSCRIRAGATGSSSASSNGIHEYILVGEANVQNINFEASFTNGFNGSVDNLTIKRILEKS